MHVYLGMFVVIFAGVSKSIFSGIRRSPGKVPAMPYPDHRKQKSAGLDKAHPESRVLDRSAVCESVVISHQEELGTAFPFSW